MPDNRLNVESNDIEMTLGVDEVRIIKAISPTVETERVEDGTQVTITDWQDAHTFVVPDGEQGPQGEKGDKGDKGDPGVGISDVQISGTSIIENNIANIPIASSSTPGVVKADELDDVISTGGIATIDGKLYVIGANELRIKQSADLAAPITAPVQHISAFYGLAKAAGDSTQRASSNAVGNYTDGAKASIKTMLGVTDPAVSDVQINGTSVLNQGVAEIPVANASRYGVVRIDADYGTQNLSDRIAVQKAADDQVKAGTQTFRPIVPFNQHLSAFYGLAKAAGDTTQSSSSNAVGEYTDSAKAKILSMIGERNYATLIADYTTTEDLARLTINTDTNGNPFYLDSMLVYVKMPEALGNEYFSAGAYARSVGTDIDSYISFPTLRLLSNIQTTFVYLISSINGIPLVLGKASSGGNAQAAQWSTAFTIMEYIVNFVFEQHNSSSQQIPAGTNIKIYGARHFMED